MGFFMQCTCVVVFLISKKKYDMIYIYIINSFPIYPIYHIKNPIYHIPDRFVSFLSSLFASAICPAGDMVPTSEPTLEPSLEPTKDGDNGLLATSGATVVAGGAFAAWASVCVGALSAFF